MKACPQCQERFADTADFCPHHGHPLVPIVITDKSHRGDYDRLIGTVIDSRYVVDAKLGEGGMGVVFKAHHKVIEKEVAIKVLRRDLARDASVVQRFLQEAKAASRIGHANIVDVMDFGTLPDGAAYSVMEFIDGVTLAKVLRDTGRMTAARALPIMVQMARAVGVAHDKGIVHRDLKPDNVFVVEKDGRRDQVKIVDFGIAKILAQSPVAAGTPRLTRVGAIFGTPDYMAPEQAAGRSDIDQRVDVYALGTILYEMLVGHCPHRSENPLSVLTMQLLDPIVPPRRAAPGIAISDELEAVIMKALAKERDQRFRTMPELLGALEAAAGAIPLEVPPARSGPIATAAPVVPSSAPAVPTMASPRAVPSPAHGVPALPTPKAPVVFVERRSGAPVLPPDAKHPTLPPAGRRRWLAIAGAAIVLTAAVAVAIVVAQQDEAPAAAHDAAAVAMGPARPDASAPAPSPPDAAATVAPAPADAAPPRRPAHPVRPLPAPTPDLATAVVHSEPRGGQLFLQGKAVRDGATVKGVPGTSARVTCKLESYQEGDQSFVFGKDAEVTCRMSELKPSPLR